MRRSVLAPTTMGLATAVLLLTACAQGGAPGGSGGGGPVPGGSGGDELEFRCHDVAVPDAVLSDGATADQLGERAATALEWPEIGDIDPREWRILRETRTEVYLVREMPEPRAGDGELRTHEILGFEWVDETEWGGEGWQAMIIGDCALRYDMGGLGDAVVTLDPDNPPDPAATEVDLLATEIDCASGERADGRIEIDYLAEEEDRVVLVVGVRPQETGPGTGQSCQSNPPTPFTVELDAPLGDRSLVDISVYPEREIALAPGHSQE